MLKSLKCEHKVKRKLPVTFDILNWAHSEFWEVGISTGAGAELFRAIVLGGFLFLTSYKRIGTFEMGKRQVRYRCRRGPDHYVRNHPEKTDPYNECESKVRKEMQHPM